MVSKFTPSRRPPVSIRVVKAEVLKLLQMHERELEKVPGLPWRSPKQVHARLLITYICRDLGHSLPEIATKLHYAKYKERSDHSGVRNLLDMVDRMDPDQFRMFQAQIGAVYKALQPILLEHQTSHPDTDPVI